VMAGLVRTITGKFKIENSLTIEEISKACEENFLDKILVPAEKLLELPVVELDENQLEAYMNGRKIVIVGIVAGEYLVKSYTGDTIGIGTADETRSLKSRKRL